MNEWIEECLRIDGSIVWRLRGDELEISGDYSAIIESESPDVTPGLEFLERQVFSEDLPRLRTLMGKLNNGQAVNGAVEYRLKMPDGRTKHLCLRVNTDEVNGQVLGFLRDVTGRYRRSEKAEQLATLVEYSPNFVGIAELDGRLQYLNRSGRDMLGIMEDAVTSSRIIDLFPHELGPKVEQEIIPGALELGRWAGEVEFRHFDSGAGIPMWLDLFRIDDRLTGRPTHLATVSRDFSENRKVHEVLEKSREELEQLVKERTRELDLALKAAERANQAKSDFISQISHELRTPLNIVLGYSQVLEIDTDLGGESSPQAQYLREIQVAGNHLLTLIDEILDLGGLEHGSLQVADEAVRLDVVINDCVGQMQMLANDQEISLFVYLDERYNVRGDQRRITQVLLNLLSNAIKFNRGGGEVHLTVRRDGQMIRTEIVDTGRGIPSDVAEKVFEPFERGVVHEDAVAGSGIGLAIVKSLVEAMGGEVGYESSEEEGSRFWFDLRASEEDVDSPEMMIALYVEDDLANMRLMQAIFERIDDCELVTAPTGGEAIKLAKAMSPSLVLLDINLPDMSGVDVLRELRTQFSNLPVFAVTAELFKFKDDPGSHLGFDGVIPKPFSVNEIISLVSEYT